MLGRQQRCGCMGGAVAWTVLVPFGMHPLAARASLRVPVEIGSTSGNTGSSGQQGLGGSIVSNCICIAPTLGNRVEGVGTKWILLRGLQWNR